MIDSSLKLPIMDILPRLDQVLQNQNKLVLVAPPGAGKTSLVPLHLLKNHAAPSGFLKNGKIIMLEPRRIAARSAARHMAKLIGEEVGETIGYQMRMERKISKKTKILIVTEGVFARMILDDPELTGVHAVIFDEFHERSLDADFGLALLLDVQQAIRQDLRIVIMSATLDGAKIAKLLDNAPILESHGRAFPVEIRYQPKKLEETLEEAMALAIQNIIQKEEGSVLAFLPGQKEILRTRKILEEKLSEDIMICPLFGAMDSEAQDKAILKPKDNRRKIVLATSIAESSLTIDAVRIVIDSGLSRVPVYEAETGITRLVTVKASKAAIKQRIGRAGRTCQGLAIMLFHEGQIAALPDYDRPEILSADLSNLLLDCAEFGIYDLNDLIFLDKPPEYSLEEAKKTLIKLGGLDKNGHITAFGKDIQKQALPVRLAAMVLKAKNPFEKVLAAEIAIVLTERGLGGLDVDLEKRIESFRSANDARSKRARLLVKNLSSQEKGASLQKIGQLLLYAWPDRIAKSRGDGGRFLLMNKRGAMLLETSPLAKAPFLVVAEMTGSAENGRIMAAAEIDEATLENHFLEEISTKTELKFNPQTQNFQATEYVTLGAIILRQKNCPLPKGEEANLAMLEAIHLYGLEILPWNEATLNLRQRLHWLHQHFQASWPNLSDEFLKNNLKEWLLPYLHGQAVLSSIKPKDLYNAILNLVPYALQKDIDIYAPTHFTVPTGSKIAISYQEEPTLSVRVQELYGLDYHPTIAKGQVALVLRLLSPAYRPIQITRDLPRFWQGSWADMRADMRGRYPKHAWPENPRLAEPTKRAKRRKE